MKRAARYIIFYAALFGLWTLLAELKIWPPYLFPTPWGVGEALYAGFKDHSYWIAIRGSWGKILCSIVPLRLRRRKYDFESRGGN